MTTLPPEVENETRLRNLCDIAEREHTREQLQAARQQHREWMRNHGAGDPMEAAALRLQEMDAAGHGNTVKARALVLHAAASIRDEGREGRDEVPSQDRPGGDPGPKAKGKRAARAKREPKSKRSTAWLRHLGNRVASYRASFGVDDTRLLEMLRAGAFRATPSQIRSEPVWGLIRIDEPTADIRDLAALPALGSDPEYVVFGLRRDAKTGCPTHRFRFDAEATATQDARAAGQAEAHKAAIRERIDALVSDWYATATPQTTIWPIVYHRPSFTFHVMASVAEAHEEAASLISRTVGGLTRAGSALQAVEVEDLVATELRHQGGQGSGDADLGADLLLWLVGRQLGGTGVLTVGDSKLEWWLDESCALDRKTVEGEKPLRVRLGGAPAEGGSLATALADGAVLRSARLTLRTDEQDWTCTVSGGVAEAWDLPTLTRPDGTAAGLDAAVDERLRLWERGRALFGALVDAFLRERLDRGTWRQRVSAVQRSVLKGVDDTRTRFVASTGQVALFAEQVAEYMEGQNAEHAPNGETKRSRGRRARDAASPTTAGA